jgi:hypothetical protein
MGIFQGFSGKGEDEEHYHFEGAELIEVLTILARWRPCEGINYQFQAYPCHKAGYAENMHVVVNLWPDIEEPNGLFVVPLNVEIKKVPTPKALESLHKTSRRLKRHFARHDPRSN